MAKHIAVKVLGTASEPLDCHVQVGQTAGEVLEGLGLHGYVLSFPNASKFFGNEEPIYASVVDGDKLEASTKTQVGRN